MKVRRSTLLGLAIVALSVAVSLAVATALPDRMASHWNATGEVDGTMPTTLGLFFLPAVALGLLGLFVALPRIDPLRENVEEFRGYYDLLVLAVVGFLAYLHLVVLAANLGYEFPMGQAVAPAMGVLYVVLGVIVENAERNWSVGVRTPWTLSNDEVWRRTHDLAGPMFKLAGAVAVLGAVVPAYAVSLAVVPLVVISLLLVGHSYYVSRRLDGR